MPSGRKTIRTRRPAAAHDRATAYARSHRSLRASGMMATSCTRLSFSCSVCPSSHWPSPPTLEVAGIEPPNVLHKRSTHALLSTTMTGFRFSQGAAPSTLSKRYSRGSTPCIEPCEPHPIEKAKQRRGGRAGRYSLAELATDIWTLAGIDGEPTVVEWVSERPESEAWIRIPSERPAVLWENPLFPDSTVYFGQSRRERVNCGTTEQARLVRRLAELGVVGDVKVPDGGGAEILREEVDARVGVAKERFEGLAEARTSNTRQREQLVEMLVLWYVRGQT